MSIVNAAKAYLALNALLALIALMILTMKYLSQRIRFADQLKLAYFLLFAAVTLPFLTLAVAPNVFEPTSQVWTAMSMKDTSFKQQTPRPAAISLTYAAVPKDVTTHLPFLLGVTLVGVFLAASYVGRSLYQLRRIRDSAAVIYRFRSVRILISEHVSIPFSFWHPFRSYVVLPQELVTAPNQLRLAVAHEMQHHRQHDTKWLHLMSALKIICCWNPLIYVLDRQLSNIQEFACDEALVGHRRISSLAYCRCLLWVAESALQNSHPLVGTTSMVDGAAGKTLKRRIEFMLTAKGQHVPQRLVVAIGAVALTIMVGVAFAASSSIQDRRISWEQARRMAESAQQDSQFPIVVNELVLEQLNRLLGTPDGRQHLKSSFARMEEHRDVVTAALKQYGLPSELMAIPVVESGYKNLPPKGKSGYGAGLWMFIKSTARNYGLKVDAHADERLNIPRETDAAMRLLAALNLQFKDWSLALLGYNAGAGAVEKGINQTGSRDPWHLVRNGYGNDPGYLAEVMAVALILKNPSYLD